MSGVVPAKLKYEQTEYEVIEWNDGFVVCCMTGEQIPLEYLRYWNVDAQVPFKDVHAGMAWMKLMGVGPYSPESIKGQAEARDWMDSRENKQQEKGTSENGNGDDKVVGG